MVEICIVPPLGSIVPTFICFPRTGRTLVMSFCTQFLSTIIGLPFMFTAEGLHTSVSHCAALLSTSQLLCVLSPFLASREML